MLLLLLLRLLLLVTLLWLRLLHWLLHFLNLPLMLLLLLHHHLLHLKWRYHLRLHLTLRTYAPQALHVELLELLLNQEAFMLQNGSLTLKVRVHKRLLVERRVHGWHEISKLSNGELGYLHRRHWSHWRDREWKHGRHR